MVHENSVDDGKFFCKVEMSGLLSVRGFIHLMRRSTAAGNANVGIVTRCRCFSSASVVGTSISQEGAGKKVADSGPRSVVVTETKPEEDEAVKLEICGDIEGDKAYQY